MSHHTNDPEKLAKLAKINAHHVSLFAYLVDKLRATPDGDGSLLDHSIYMLGSGMGNPDIHNHTNLPIVLAGGRTAGIKGARHIKYEQATPLANLHLTLLDKVGVHLDSFVDSNGKVSELEPLGVGMSITCFRDVTAGSTAAVADGPEHRLRRGAADAVKAADSVVQHPTGRRRERS